MSVQKAALHRRRSPVPWSPPCCPDFTVAVSVTTLPADTDVTVLPPEVTASVVVAPLVVVPCVTLTLADVLLALVKVSQLVESGV